MEEFKVCWKNIGLNSDLVSELFYQIYYMGVYRALGEDEIKPEPTPQPDAYVYYIGMMPGTKSSVYSKTPGELISSSSEYNNLRYTYTYTLGDSGLVNFYVILSPGVEIESGSLRSGELETEYEKADFTNPTYFDIQYGDFDWEGEKYRLLGVRGISLCDPGNTITLNFTKKN